MRRSVQTRLPAILKSRPLHESILYHKRGMLSGYVRLDECHASLARSAMPILGVTTRPVMPIRHDAHRAQRRIRHSPALRNDQHFAYARSARQASLTETAGSRSDSLVSSSQRSALIRVECDGTVHDQAVDAQLAYRAGISQLLAICAYLTASQKHHYRYPKSSGVAHSAGPKTGTLLESSGDQGKFIAQ